MNQTIPFRKDTLDALLANKKRYYISDSKTPYLKLVVYETGNKVYILNRTVNNRSQKIKIGKYDCLTIEQARKQAKDLNARIELGGDPYTERLNTKRAMTFEELYEVYYKQHAVKFTKNPGANKKTMEVHIFPVLEKLKAEAISRHQITDLHTKIGETISRYSKGDVKKKSYGSANRVLNIVSAVFNFAIKQELIVCNSPCSGLKKYKAVSRDRFLSLEELKKFLKALQNEDQSFSDLFKILLFTGARKGNVLSMKWADIDLGLKRWRIPETHTKNKEVNIVALSEEVVQILFIRLKANKGLEAPSPYVFPSEGKSGHLADPKKSFNRIKKRIGVSDIRIHDLRRTLGSYMAISGASMPIIGKALNHKSQVSTAIYARLSNDPVLNAVNIATKLMI